MEKEKLFMNTSSPLSLNYTGLSLPPPNWQSSSGVGGQLREMNCSSEQFLNLNWENSMDQAPPFGLALSSIASNSSGGPANSAVIRELSGRLGSICNNGEIYSDAMVGTGGGRGASYIGGNGNSNNTSCYTTPLNSPPKLNLSMMDHQIRGNLPVVGNSMAPSLPLFAAAAADPGFAERAAKFCCFDSKNFGQFPSPEAELQYKSLPGMENGKMLRVSSNQSMKAGSEMGVLGNKDTVMQDGLEAEMRSGSASGSASDRKFSRLSRSSTPDDDDAEFGNAREETSVTEPISKGPNEGNARKRKAAARGKAKASAKGSKEAEDHDLNAKRCKAAEAMTEEKGSPTEGNGGKNQTKDSSKPSEPSKQDYIHVRARRGQATDSHSLAERVRREKISERMKFLQDLVPGCNKVTGKAVMLDEIINYVQSLQRQVEFLSMKLATVNPRLDFNMEALLSKDILQSCGSLPQTAYPLDSSASVFTYGHQPQQGPLQTVVSNGLETMNPLDATLRQTLGTQLPAIDGHGNTSSQVSTFWEDDLQSLVHMGFLQSREMAFPSQSFQGSLFTDHMKVEQ